MKKYFLCIFLIMGVCMLASCSNKQSKNEIQEIKDIANSKTDFKYQTAKQAYGMDIALKAVKKREITSVDAIIINKYIGNKEDVVIPEEIDGHPVEVIDNYAFSPYDYGLEKDDDFWENELKNAGLPLKGNGTSLNAESENRSSYFNAFIDAIVSTAYRMEGGTAEDYDPAKHYIYYDDDFEKVISYLKSRKKSSIIESVTIPESIRSIGGAAFFFCDNLKSVNFGRGRTICNDFAFAFCTELEEINSALTADLDGCFLGCVNLKKATVKGHHLGTFMFAGCIKLEFLTVARQTAYAKKYALYRCPNLSSCNFPLAFKLGPDFLDFNTFTAKLSKEDVSYKEFKEMGYPFELR